LGVVGRAFLIFFAGNLGGKESSVLSQKKGKKRKKSCSFLEFESSF
jgi:hypothetical protein